MFSPNRSITASHKPENNLAKLLRVFTATFSAAVRTEDTYNHQR
jgi:hypothetical protein